MVFTSFNFLIFFPIIIVISYLTPKRYRWLTLLMISYLFYTNINPVFTLLLLSVTVCTYFFTRLIHNTENDQKRTIYLRANIVLILLPLIFFKYFGDINNQLLEYFQSKGLHWNFPEMKLLLPIGISYYTFMAIGYAVDVYNEEVPFEKNIGRLGLFISFFPLILSGPIERAKNMLPQFQNLGAINYGHISAGLKLILWGYFMKLVVADRISIYVDAVYGNLEQHNGTTILFATILYPFQVYADLGGYSLIAIGVSKALGFDVMDNFKRPFFAASMSEFWRRWHISLISWLTDYVYTPLSFVMRKYHIWGIVVALMLTFFISGIWHGARMTFVVWGILQGFFLSLEALTSRKKTEIETKYGLQNRELYVFLNIILTFVLFSISQIFGRAESISEAVYVLNNLYFDGWNFYTGSLFNFLFAIIGLLILLIKDYFDEFYPKKILLFENTRLFIRFSSYIILIIAIFFMGNFENSSFIYFRY